jgi:hypothetical protein
MASRQRHDQRFGIDEAGGDHLVEHRQTQDTDVDHAFAQGLDLVEHGHGAKADQHVGRNLAKPATSEGSSE